MIGVKQLQGTAVEGRLRLDEGSINELLRAIAPQRDMALRLSDNNRIVIQVGSFHAKATVAPHLSLSPTPRLHLRLDSLLIATGLRAVAPQPLVTVRGREVEIDLAALPGFDAARDWLSHLTRLEIATAPGTLQLHFAWSVKD